VVRIAGRGPGAASATPWHFTGVHVMSPAVFDFMAPAGEEDINRGVYPRMMDKGLVIRGEVVSAPWSDLGTPARYLAAHGALLSERIPMSAFVGASPFEGLTRRAGLWVCNGAQVLGDVHGPAFVESGAFIAPGARLEGGVSVGARSRVSEGARVARSAIFADTTVAAGETLADAIAWEDRRLAASHAA
jgi:mannose-1-phosphate guanylyltransferase